MIRTMNGTIRALAEGYRILLHNLARAVLGLVALTLAAAAVTLPVWLLAVRAPRVFNTLFLTATAVFLLRFFHQRIRRGSAHAVRNRPREKGHGRRIASIRLAILTTGLVVLWGLSTGSVPIALIGAFAFFTALAWSQGVRLR